MQYWIYWYRYSSSDHSLRFSDISFWLEVRGRDRFLNRYIIALMHCLLFFRILFSHFLRLIKLGINIIYSFLTWSLQKATTSHHLFWNSKDSLFICYFLSFYYIVTTLHFCPTEILREDSKTDFVQGGLFKVPKKMTLGKALSPVTSSHGGIFHYGSEADAIFMHYKATLYQFIAPQMSALILMAAKHIANMFCPLMPWNRVIIPF